MIIIICKLYSLNFSLKYIDWLIDLSYCKKLILAGNWVITLEKPTVISALSVVHKPDSDDLRLIHDCPYERDWMSIPYISIDKQKLETIDSAVKLLSATC